MRRRQDDLNRYITKNADGTYNVRVCARIGKKHLNRRASNLLSIAEARNVRNKMVDEVSEVQRRYKSGILWRDALETYLTKETRIQKPKTFYDVSMALRSYTQGWFDLPITEITTTQVISAIENRDCDDATKNKVVGYVSRLFKYFMKRGQVQVNPTVDVHFGPFRKKRRAKLKAMKRSEVDLLLSNAYERQHSWRDIWFVAYHTGMRSGELMALRWRSVDLENNVITVEYAYDGESFEADLKDHDTRYVPIGPELKDCLFKLREGRNEADFVLPQLKDWRNGRAAQILRDFQRDLGITECNFHSIRASFITHLRAEGVAIATIQDIVGHEDYKTTREYVRPTGEDVKGATDALSRGKVRR